MSYLGNRPTYNAEADTDLTKLTATKQCAWSTRNTTSNPSTYLSNSVPANDNSTIAKTLVSNYLTNTKFNMLRSRTSHFCRTYSKRDLRSCQMNTNNPHAPVDYQLMSMNSKAAWNIQFQLLQSSNTHTHPFNVPLSGTTRVSRY